MVTFIHGLSTFPHLRGETDHDTVQPPERSGVLVGYDASPESDQALEWAADLAERRGEPLRVLVVAEPLDSVVTPSWPRSWSADVERHARDLLDRRGLTGPTDTAIEHRVGAVVPTMVDASENAAVLVLGSRGHGLVGQLVVGSVSQGSARRAHCPVVVVRPSEHPDDGRVVVGVDGSASSTRALAFACGHALATGQRLTLLHARRTPQPPPVDERGNVPADLSATLLVEEQALDHAVAVVREHFPDLAVEGDFIATSAGDALVEASRRASLVVVGARSRHPVVESVLGSVSRQVLHHAHCPVGVVR